MSIEKITFPYWAALADGAEHYFDDLKIIAPCGAQREARDPVTHTAPKGRCAVCKAAAAQEAAAQRNLAAAAAARLRRGVAVVDTTPIAKLMDDHVEAALSQKVRHMGAKDPIDPSDREVAGICIAALGWICVSLAAAAWADSVAPGWLLAGAGLLSLSAYMLRGVGK